MDGDNEKKPDVLDAQLTVASISDVPLSRNECY